MTDNGAGEFSQIEPIGNTVERSTSFATGVRIQPWWNHGRAVWTGGLDEQSGGAGRTSSLDGRSERAVWTGGPDEYSGGAVRTECSDRALINQSGRVR